MAAHEHKVKTPKNIGVLVITVSDSRTESTDHSGQLIQDRLARAQHRIVDRHIIRDEPDAIQVLIRAALNRRDVDVIILTGGTGIAPRDSTYEVVNGMLDKRLDGFGEIFRYLSFRDIGSAAIMSRSVAGVSHGKVVISLPGSTAAVDLAMRELILPELGHLVAQAKGL